MATTRRKFTEEQKLAILREAVKGKIITVIRNHNLSYSVFSRWRNQLMKNDASVSVKVSDRKARSEFRQLDEENARLKKIIARQALELEVKEEQLKKYRDHSG